MKKRIVPVVLLIAAAAYGIYYITVVKKAGADNVYSGTVEAREVKISAEIAGRILEVAADEGDPVKKGRLLVRINHDSLDAQLAQAQAAKIAANGQTKALAANLGDAKTNLERGGNLLESGALSQQKYDSVKTLRESLSAQKEAAVGQVKSAEASAAFIQTQIDKATITSPLDGVVLQRSVEPGEMAMPGSAMLTIADLANMWVRIYIPETKLESVKIGQKIRIRSDSDRGNVYEGSVVSISDQAEFTPKNVQTKEERVRLVYGVKVDVKNPNGKLKIGMPVDAELTE